VEIFFGIFFSNQFFSKKIKKFQTFEIGKKGPVFFQNDAEGKFWKKLKNRFFFQGKFSTVRNGLKKIMFKHLLQNNTYS
jgi:hypothetical protein